MNIEQLIAFTGLDEQVSSEIRITGGMFTRAGFDVIQRSINCLDHRLCIPLARPPESPMPFCASIDGCNSINIHVTIQT